MRVSRLRTTRLKLIKDEGAGYSSRLCGVLVEHVGMRGDGRANMRAAGLLELKMYAYNDKGEYEHVSLFPTPALESLTKIAAERPRWSDGLPLKKLQAELRSAQLLVDGLAALVCARCSSNPRPAGFHALPLSHTLVPALLHQRPRMVHARRGDAARPMGQGTVGQNYVECPGAAECASCLWRRLEAATVAHLRGAHLRLALEAHRTAERRASKQG